MAETGTNRIYAFGTQTDYQTAKTLASNALRKMIVSDKNFIDVEPKVANDEDWSHGANNFTDQWLEAHDCKVSHSMPAFIEEIPRIFKLGMGTYAVSTPSGGITSKEHVFNLLDVATTRQLQAATYAEKLGAHNVLMPSAIVDGFTLQGNDLGVLMLDFGLQGSGKITNPSGVNWTTHIAVPSALKKLYNTQIALGVTDGVTPVNYGCKYRNFKLSWKNNLLLDAGFKPGCDQYQTTGDKTSGAIRSECLIDKQMADFDFEVDLENDSGELEAVVKQKPMSITLTAAMTGAGGLIEGSIYRTLNALMTKTYYNARKIGEGNGYQRFQINAKVATDPATSKSLEIKVVNDVATYATW